MIKRIAPVLALLLLSLSSTLRADAIADWNLITSQVITASTHTGPSVMIDFAAVHVAMHDAVQSIEGRYHRYHSALDSATGSTTVAAATAARDVLVHRFPAQASAIEARYQQFLSEGGLSADDPAAVAGSMAATAVNTLRATDRAFPSTPPPPYVGDDGIGSWRPTPSYLGGASFAPMATPWLAGVTPFAVRSTSQFRAKPAPALDSREYAHDYNEVKAVGSATSLTRTQAQTDAALFWSDNTPMQWNRALRAIVPLYGDNIGDSARIFALATMSAADALITCWDTKIHYNVWRPVTAIHEAAHDGNADTEADPDWKPLINTPNYPDYSSGANALTGAVTRTLQLVLGRDDAPVTITSNVTSLPVEKRTRSYDRLSDVASEVVDARIYLGIHFRFADTAARQQGERIAQWAFAHHLKPVSDDREKLDPGRSH